VFFLILLSICLEAGGHESQSGSLLIFYMMYI
jgi:hypothetical protein